MSTGAAKKLETELQAEVARYRGETFADNTKRTYTSHSNSFLRFCTELCVPPVPANEKTIAMYAACLARRLRPASVRQYLNIVRVMHLEAGLSNPLKDSWFISSTLKGIDRVKGTAVNRKSPITPDILRIKKVLKMSDRDDIVFWAACLVMFFGLFRKANLFAKQKFDADKHFTRDSFVLNADCSLTICVRWSKTIQCREREIRVTLPALHPHRLCPVSAVCQALRAAVHQSPKAPAFPMSGAVFDKTLKAVTQGEGNLSGHSFRRGEACWALSQNIPGEIIKIMGDWKSTVYMSYLDQVPQPVGGYLGREVRLGLNTSLLERQHT